MRLQLGRLVHIVIVNFLVGFFEARAQCIIEHLQVGLVLVNETVGVLEFPFHLFFNLFEVELGLVREVALLFVRLLKSILYLLEIDWYVVID